ncbi:MAG: glycosyltransferase [Eubacteriales bacterium]|nr:glycosyltransferase [Eubacteriales bacterium]
MRIVLVTDACGELNNGTTMTTYRFAQNLRARGHEVVILACGENASPQARVEEYRLPIVTSIVHSEGFALGKADEAVFRRVFARADIVHFLLPLPFDRRAMTVCREMGVPMSAAFHLQPENVTYAIHLPFDFLATAVYRIFRAYFYSAFTHIHCPSAFIARELEKNGYQAQLHVISNGVDEAFVPGHEPAGDGLFHILMVGRLSPEKRQDVLIEAIRRSRHEKEIQLHLAGQGPCEKKLRRAAEHLTHPVTFGFYEKEALLRLIHRCDLYVHASYIEIEAISCMEAFACGLVPVICNSPKSATVQFALTERSLFLPDDPEDLARQIDYWIEHPAEREEMGRRYAEQGKEYSVAASVEKAEQMFMEVIAEYEKRKKECAEIRYTYFSAT